MRGEAQARKVYHLGALEPGSLGTTLNSPEGSDALRKALSSQLLSHYEAARSVRVLERCESCQACYCENIFETCSETSCRRSRFTTSSSPIAPNLPLALGPHPPKPSLLRQFIKETCYGIIRPPRSPGEFPQRPLPRRAGLDPCRVIVKDPLLERRALASQQPHHGPSQS